MCELIIQFRNSKPRTGWGRKVRCFCIILIESLFIIYVIQICYEFLRDVYYVFKRWSLFQEHQIKNQIFTSRTTLWSCCYERLADKFNLPICLTIFSILSQSTIKIRINLIIFLVGFSCVQLFMCRTMNKAAICNAIFSTIVPHIEIGLQIEVGHRRASDAHDLHDIFVFCRVGAPSSSANFPFAHHSSWRYTLASYCTGRWRSSHDARCTRHRRWDDTAKVNIQAGR